MGKKLRNSAERKKIWKIENIWSPLFVTITGTIIASILLARMFPNDSNEPKEIISTPPPLASESPVNSDISQIDVDQFYRNFYDSSKIANSHAVSILCALDIIHSYEDGSYRPADYITRAESAVMLCRLINGGEGPSQDVYSSTYVDTNDHWAREYIEFCTAHGIMSGNGNSEFLPDSYISYPEFAKTLFGLLGYNADYEKFDGSGWEKTVNFFANKNGLYDNLFFDFNEYVSRDNAAQIMFNALGMQMVSYTKLINGNGDTVPELIVSTTNLHLFYFKDSNIKLY